MFEVNAYCVCVSGVENELTLFEIEDIFSITGVLVVLEKFMFMRVKSIYFPCSKLERYLSGVL